MKSIFEILLPANLDNVIHGTKIPFYLFALYAIASAVRSCIHLLSPDGGADEIVFAMWGSFQLLAVIRYRSLIPFMWLMLALEVLLRELVGKMKPVTFAHTLE